MEASSDGLAAKSKSDVVPTKRFEMESNSGWGSIAWFDSEQPESKVTLIAIQRIFLIMVSLVVVVDVRYVMLVISGIAVVS